MLSDTILNSKLRRIAFFDFCETLAGFQTANAFIDFVRTTDGHFFMTLLNTILIVLKKVRITLVFNKFFPNASLEKRLKLLQLRGYKYEELNNLAGIYYQVMIKPNLIKVVIEEMKELRGKNYELCIVSAAYSIYLKYFAEEHQVQHIISTEIAFYKPRSICRGTISGKDCINIEKVNRVKAYFVGQDINYEDSISYSDSITDLPMLLLTGEGVVVSKNHSQQWCQQYRFRETIWN